MIPTGKGIYIWKIPRLGNIRDVVNALVYGEFNHVIIKIAGGKYPSNLDEAPILIEALKYVGIEVWGYQYIYLADPVGEARFAVTRMIETDVVGLFLDVEKECKNKPTETVAYCNEIRKLTTMPLGLASYRYPHYHPEIAWNTWRAICNFDAPQVYWQGAHNPAEQLEESYQEFDAMEKKLPYVPTGSAYSEYDWCPLPEELEEFIAACNEHGWPYNFWELYEAWIENPELWPVLCDGYYDPDFPEPPPAPEMVRVTYAGGLYIRNAPSLSGVKLGGAYYGSIWYIMGREKDADGREWVQLGPNAYMAGWYTEAV